MTSKKLPSRSHAVLYATSVISLALLAACGGGGGDSGTPISPVSSSLSISAANYQQVAQVVMSTTGYLTDAGDFALGEPSGAAAQSTRHVKAQQARPRATSSETLSCTQGGSLQLSFNDQNNNGSWDVGDTLRATAINCREDGLTLQGGLGLNAKALSGSFGSGSYSATLQLSLENFIITEGSDTSTGNGNLDMQISVTAGTTELTLVVDAISVAGTEAGQLYNHSLRDARLNLRLPLAGGGTSSTSGTVSSSKLGDKSVRIETPTPFVTAAQAQFPSSGQMLISGANGSKLRLSAQSAALALLELDADGDGSYETRSTKAWSELN